MNKERKSSKPEETSDMVYLQNFNSHCQNTDLSEDNEGDGDDCDDDDTDRDDNTNDENLTDMESVGNFDPIAEDDGGQSHGRDIPVGRHIHVIPFNFLLF